LLQNWSDFIFDESVPNAGSAVTVKLQSSNPCTVVVAGAADMLQPTDACCSCMRSQVRSGRVTHCQVGRAPKSALAGELTTPSR